MRGRRRARHGVLRDGVRDGTVFWDPSLPELETAQRTKLYDEQNRALAALHSVDPAKVGLADFGKAGSYFARQRDRWTKQYSASETERIEDMETLIAWLEQNEPPDDGRSSLVHGDYRIDNMIFTPDGARAFGRDRLGAVDPRPPVLGPRLPVHAVALSQSRTCAASRSVDRNALGIPTEEQYVARYCERMGLAGIPSWNFCLSFSFFRLAAIVQGVKKRGLEGNASNPEQALKSGERMPMMAKMGAGVI